MDLILIVSLIIVLLLTGLYVYKTVFLSGPAPPPAPAEPGAPADPPKISDKWQTPPAIKSFLAKSCDYPAYFDAVPIHDGPHNILSYPDHEELH